LALRYDVPVVSAAEAEDVDLLARVSKQINASITASIIGLFAQRPPSTSV